MEDCLSNEPLEQADPKFLIWKTVFLVALASGRRRSEIHALSFQGFSHSRNWSKVVLKLDPSFLAKNQLTSAGAGIFEEIAIPSLSKSLPQNETQDLSLCPVRALRIYVSRTQDLRRNKSLLFVSYRPSFPGDISSQTISFWIKGLIHYCLQHCSAENAALVRVKAHEVRALASSWAFRGGVPLQDTWRNHTTFTSFYFRDLALSRLDGSYKLGDVVVAQHIV